MRQLSQREYVLLGLLALAGVILFHFAPKGGIGAAGHESFGDVARLGDEPVVHIDRLAGRTDDYDSQGRNLFQYYTPARRAVEPPPMSPSAPKQPTTPRSPVDDREPAHPRQPSEAQPPAINLTYLGFLGPKDKPIAVFEDGKEMLLARRGDVLRQQFRLVDFGHRTVLMGYVDERFRGATQELPQRSGAAEGG
jgi:hypothetical protein